MIKKTLLTGACLSSLFAASMPLQAAQQHASGGMSPPSHCPPCPGGGGQMGWVLVPYGSMLPGGTPCEPGHGAGGESPGGLHEPAGTLPHHETPTHGILEPHPHEPQNHIPVSPGSHVHSAQPKGEEPTAIQEQREEPRGTAVGGEEPKKTPVDTQEAINKSKPVLMKVDGKNRWGKVYEGKKWIRGENGMWELLEENSTGQTRPAAAPKGGEEESRQPEKEPVFFSSTNRPYTRGPGTYNPVVPGARGTPQEKLSPVNRPVPKAPEGE